MTDTAMEEYRVLLVERLKEVLPDEELADRDCAYVALETINKMLCMLFMLYYEIPNEDTVYRDLKQVVATALETYRDQWQARN